MLASTAQDRHIVLYDTRENNPLRKIILAQKTNSIGMWHCNIVTGLQAALRWQRPPYTAMPCKAGNRRNSLMTKKDHKHCTIKIMLLVVTWWNVLACQSYKQLAATSRSSHILHLKIIKLININRYTAGQTVSSTIDWIGLYDNPDHKLYCKNRLN